MESKVVFIIDDDEIFIYGAERQISRIDDKFIVKTYHNGLEALNELKKLNVENHKAWPKIIFVDLNMPVMDGWEFLDNLKEIETPELTKVYIVTSSIDGEDKKRASSYAIANYIIKPINRTEMEEVLRQQE